MSGYQVLLVSPNGSVLTQPDIIARLPKAFENWRFEVRVIEPPAQPEPTEEDEGDNGNRSS